MLGDLFVWHISRGVAIFRGILLASFSGCRPHTKIIIVASDYGLVAGKRGWQIINKSAAFESEQGDPETVWNVD